MWKGTRRGLAAVLVVVIFFVGSLSALAPLGRAAATEPLRFGMDIDSIRAQTEAGAKPDYGMIWIGVWNLKHGWGGPDAALERSRDAGVTPVVQFYYWGDDISKECIENGCWSNLHGAQKDKAGWNQLAQELVAHLNAKMQGKPVVIILETEFNKGNVATYEPLDGYLEEKAMFFRQNYPNAKIVLGLGNWGHNKWDTWDRAAGASDFIGIQGLRGSTRDSLPRYKDLPNDLVKGANEAVGRFNKPVFISDIAISSYPEPEYSEHQRSVLAEIFSRLSELKDAGIMALMYRSWRDTPNADPANYYGEAERHWGFVRPDGTRKPAANVWIEGVKKERAEAPEPVTPPPAPPEPSQPPFEGSPVEVVNVGKPEKVVIESENFATKSVGTAKSDGAASGGHVWVLQNNGGISQVLNFESAGVYEIRVMAKGTSAGNVEPHMEVSFNDNMVLVTEVGSNYLVYHALVEVDTPGQRVLGMAFTNGESASSRSLVLDKAAVEWMGPLSAPSADGVTRVEAEDMNKFDGQVIKEKGASGGQVVSLSENGRISHNVEMKEGVYSIRVVAKRIPQAGLVPLLEVMLDGESIALHKITNDSHRVYYAQGSVRTPGSHEISFAFTNDATPSGKQDLGINVDRIAVEKVGENAAEPSAMPAPPPPPQEPATDTGDSSSAGTSGARTRDRTSSYTSITRTEGPRETFTATAPSVTGTTFELSPYVNNWWMEVYAGGGHTVRAVEVQFDGGRWHPLEKTRWASWGSVIYMSSGEAVQFRATLDDGGIVYSEVYSIYPI